MKIAVVFTMKGCPFCTMIKEEMDKNNIIFVERDIEKYHEEYEEFSRETQNDFVPALILMTVNEEDEATDVRLMAPDRDFKDIFEAVELTKQYILE